MNEDNFIPFAVVMALFLLFGGTCMYTGHYNTIAEEHNRTQMQICKEKGGVVVHDIMKNEICVPEIRQEIEQ